MGRKTYGAPVLELVLHKLNVSILIILAEKYSTLYGALIL